MNFRAIVTTAILGATLTTSANAQISWDLGTSAGNAAVSSNSVSYLTASSVSQNNNHGVTTMLSAASPSSGYLGASGQYNAASSGVAGQLNLSTSTYYQFTLTPSIGYEVSLSSISFGTRSTSSGPTNVAVYTSDDDFTYAIALGNSTSTWALISSGPLTNISGTAASPLVVRIYGYGGSGSTSTANWRIDDLTASGVSVVPEASNYAAIFGGVALVAPFCSAAAKQQPEVSLPPSKKDPQ